MLVKIRNLVLGAALLLMVAGCGDNPTPTQVANPAPTSSSQESPVAFTPGPRVTAPTFNFVPRRGVPGTRVSVIGANFKPNTKVVMRIGTPKPIGEALATSTVGADGRWSMDIVIPGTLPSGKPIVSTATGDVQLVAMDESNNVMASVPFGYVASAATLAVPVTQITDPAEPVRSYLTALQSDATGNSGQQFLSVKARAEVAAGTPVPALLGIAGTPKSFKITQSEDPKKISTNSSPVKVTLEMPTG